jgi:Tol biopolymer transport system component
MKSFTRSAPRQAIGAACIIIISGAGLFSPAHATYPGENGVIISSNIEVGQVLKTTLAGGTAAVLAENASGAVVSPNGKRIAYVDAGSGNVFIRNIDGTGAILNVTRSTAGTASVPTWSPDGQKLAFAWTSVVDTPWASVLEPLGIYTIDASGTGNKRLIYRLNSTPTNLSWSPRGDKISVESNQLLQTINPDGTGLSQVAQKAWTSSWAPDGRSLLYTRYDAGNNELRTYEVNADGSNNRAIPTAEANFVSGVASPDGSLIVGGSGTSTSTLGFVPRSGGNVTPVPVSANFSPVRGPMDWGRVPKTAMAVSQLYGSWRAAAPLAGDSDFYASESAIAVMPDFGEHGTAKQVVAVGPDGRVYHRALVTNWSEGGQKWTPFAVVPGLDASAQGIKAKKVAIAGAYDGSAQIAIVGEDDLLYHAIRFPDGRWTNGSVNGFKRLAGVGGFPNFAARDVAIATTGGNFSSPGSAHVVANGLSVGGLYHCVRAANGTWTAFGSIPGAHGRDTQSVAIAVADNGDAYTTVTQRNANGGAELLRQVRWSNGNWDSFVALGSIPADVSDVALHISGGSRPIARVAFTDKAGSTWYQERGNINVQSAWTGAAVNTKLMGTGSRAVSISDDRKFNDFIDVLVTQAQPQ